MSIGRWATQCIIGATDLSTCRIELVNAEGFISPRIGSVDWANDGTVVVQSVVRETRGVRFGLKSVSAQTTNMQAIFAEIAAKEALGQAIRLQIEEADIFDVDIFATPDYSQERWFTYDKHSEGWFEGVTMLWISKGDYA
jgi:hypothetical protein